MFDHGIKLIEFSPFSVSIRHTRNNKIPGWFLAQFDWLYQGLMFDRHPACEPLSQPFPEEDQNNPFPKPQTMASPHHLRKSSGVSHSGSYIGFSMQISFRLHLCFSFDTVQMRWNCLFFFFSSRDSSVGKGVRHCELIKWSSVRITPEFFFRNWFFPQCNSDILLCFPASLRLFHYRSRSLSSSLDTMYVQRRQTGPI